MQRERSIRHQNIYIIFYIFVKEMSCDANGRLDTKRKKRENNFKFLFILIFIIFENYFNFYFKKKLSLF